MFYWGHVIVFSAFMVQFIAFGIVSSIGIYNLEFLEEFGSSVAATSLVGSISIGVLLGAGPVASFLMNKLSYRCVALIGAFLSSVGLLCVPFAPNIVYLYVFYGVFTGLGYCLLYVPSHALCGLYFDKHRCLATGVATSGSGLGGFAFPIFIHYLIETYTWKGSMLILAGINLHHFVFAWSLRPAETYISNNSDEAGTSNNTSSADPQTSFDRKVLADPSLSTDTPMSEEFSDLGNQHTTTEHEKMLPTNGQITKTMSPSKKKNRKHCYVLCSISFLIYCINNIGWNAGGVIIYVLGPEYYTEINLDKSEAAWAITLIGLGTFIGSIIGSVIGNVKWINRICLYIMCNVLIGVVSLFMICPLFLTFAGISCVNFVWGVLFGIILALLIVVMADMLGVESLGDGLGYLMLANGIGCIIGPPLGGWLKDFSGSYFLSFLMNGCLILVSAFIMVIVPIRKKLCKNKEKPSMVNTEIVIYPSNQSD